MADKSLSLIESEKIENKIYSVRRHRVMLDFDLAELYGVETRRLNEQVKRNAERFPTSFMFQLTTGEEENLMSQIATSKAGTLINKEKHGGRRKPINVFTEYGVLMLANILRSKQAIAVSIQIIEAFVRLRQLVSANAEISAKVQELEKAVRESRNDIKLIFATINTMLNPRTKKKPKIGFSP
ncbi:MAG: ORF6N domain-containing protein [Candidatus Riflebacteria bacterium]|nr:ORF6N domain-containing protein [Candidatus Riflebacteria bacterium]